MPKYDLSFASPLMNTAGMLGFSPDLHGEVNFSRLGAFFTNPVSLSSHSPAGGPRCLPFTGGFLLHTGYPNPGFASVLKSCRERWKRSPLPVVVNLLAHGVDDVDYMVRRLEAVEGVMGVEISLPPGVDRENAASMIRAAAGELPVVARLPLESAVQLAPAAGASGASAVSLGAPRGALPVPGEDQPGTSGRIISGRLYGPGLFPLALAAVRALASLEIPVIASGGVYTLQQAQAMLAAGASAVQLDAVLWHDPRLEAFADVSAGRGA